MSLLWPWFLPLFLLLPLLVGGYIWILRRRRRFAVRYSSVALIREALPRRWRWRQHLPFALLLLAMAVLIGALARPAAEVTVPLNRTTIILALDVSLSMCATDVSPNRLTIAQQAALEFIDEQPEGTQIGLVAFAGFAEIIVPPTDDKDILRDSVANLTTSLGTAIGSATLKSIDAIAGINTDVAPSGLDLGQEAAPADNDRYLPEIIVLLTDGANSQGPLPLEAAQQAVDRQLRVYTIGFGTDEVSEMSCSRKQLPVDVFGSTGFGGGGFGSGRLGAGGTFDVTGNPDLRRFLVIDEGTLQGIADMTGGEYYRAENADQLQDVFLNLPSQVVLQTETVELSVIFVALAALLTLAALGLSLRWNRFS